MEIKKGTKLALALCLLPGIFLIVSGTMLLFAQESASTLYDMPLQDSPIVLGMGIRQLAIGLMIVILAVLRETRALGFIMIIGSIVPLSDFFIFSSTIGWVSALRHAGPVPIIFGLGIYLLFRTRNNGKHT